MSQEDNNVLNLGNGPMTPQRALNNILAGLNIAQGKGCFNLRESAFIYTSLQKLNEFVKQHETEEESKTNEQPKQEPLTPQQPKSNPKPLVTPNKKKPVEKKPLEKKPEKLPDINLEDDVVNEIIEI